MSPANAMDDLHTTERDSASRPFDDRAPHVGARPSTEDKPQPNQQPSALLQGLIKERRDEMRRTSMAAGGVRVSSLVGEPRDVQSSPIGAQPRERKQSRQLSALGSRVASAPREMGAREQEKYMIDLGKANFDLKLEIFHRRAKMDKMEAELEQIRPMAEKYKEAQALLDESVLECDKKDVAIQQAVGLILSLEEEVTYLRRVLTKYEEETKVSEKASASEVTSNSVSVAVANAEDRSVLEEKRNLVADYIENVRPASATSIRQPGFLRQQDSAASALRSLYSREGQSTDAGLGRYTRPHSTMSRTEDRETTNGDSLTVRSPSLSCLSESSFISIYGNRKENEARPRADDDSYLFEEIARESEPELPSHRSPQPVQAYYPFPDVPSVPEQTTSTAKTSRLASIDQVIQPSPVKKHIRHRSVPQQIKISDLAARLESRELRREPSFTASIYNRDALPPTPDTLSHDKASSLNSSRSIIAERSLLDGTPGALRSFASLRTSSSNVANSTSKEAITPRPRSSSDISDGIEHDRAAEAQRVLADTNLQGSYLEMLNNVHEESQQRPETSIPYPTHTPTMPYPTNMMFDGTDYFPPVLRSRQSGSSKASYSRHSEIFAGTAVTDAAPRSARIDTTRAVPIEWISDPIASANNNLAAATDIPTTPLDKFSPRKLRLANGLDHSTQTSPLRPKTPPSAMSAATAPVRASSPMRSPRSSSVGPSSRKSFAQLNSGGAAHRHSPRSPTHVRSATVTNVLGANPRAGAGIPPKQSGKGGIARRLFNRRNNSNNHSNGGHDNANANGDSSDISNAAAAGIEGQMESTAAGRNSAAARILAMKSFGGARMGRPVPPAFATGAQENDENTNHKVSLEKSDAHERGAFLRGKGEGSGYATDAGIIRAGSGETRINHNNKKSKKEKSAENNTGGVGIAKVSANAKDSVRRTSSVSHDRNPLALNPTRASDFDFGFDAHAIDVGNMTDGASIRLNRNEAGTMAGYYSAHEGPSSSLAIRKKRNGQQQHHGTSKSVAGRQGILTTGGVGIGEGVSLRSPTADLVALNRRRPNSMIIETTTALLTPKVEHRVTFDDDVDVVFAPSTSGGGGVKLPGGGGGVSIQGIVEDEGTAVEAGEPAAAVGEGFGKKNLFQRFRAASRAGRPGGK